MACGATLRRSTTSSRNARAGEARLARRQAQRAQADALESIARAHSGAAAAGLRRPDARPAPRPRQVPRSDRRDRRRLADLVAHRSVEDEDRIEGQREDGRAPSEYLKDLKLEALREDGGPGNAGRRSASSTICVELDGRSSRASALNCCGPLRSARSSARIPPIAALLAKISSPFPQHVSSTDRPGVGKTTVARLALEQAKRRGYTPFAADAPVRRGERLDAALGSARDDQSAAGQRARSDLSGQPPRVRRGRHPRAEARTGDEGARRRAVHRRDRRDGPAAASEVAQGSRGQTRSCSSRRTTIEHDPNVPAYIKKLFADGAPADFVLIGATTRDPSEIDRGDSLALRGGLFRAAHRSPDRGDRHGRGKRLGARTLSGGCAS